MPIPSNYPPGVTGNEPQITGYGDEPFDERDYSEDYNYEGTFYVVHRACGEAFDDLKIAYHHAQEGGCEGPGYELPDLDYWSVLPESEAI